MNKKNGIFVMKMPLHYKLFTSIPIRSRIIDF